MNDFTESESSSFFVPEYFHVHRSSVIRQLNCRLNENSWRHKAPARARAFTNVVIWWPTPTTASINLWLSIIAVCTARPRPLRVLKTINFLKNGSLCFFDAMDNVAKLHCRPYAPPALSFCYYITRLTPTPVKVDNVRHNVPKQSAAWMDSCINGQ